jgi:hypothetical protein
MDSTDRAQLERDQRALASIGQGIGAFFFVPGVLATVFFGGGLFGSSRSMLLLSLLALMTFAPAYKFHTWKAALVGGIAGFIVAGALLFILIALFASCAPGGC